MNAVRPQILQRKSHDFLRAKKRAGHKITMLTCYDYPTARLEDRAGIDIIFVGDSVGTNVLGYSSERDVTMADMLHHLGAVRRGVEHAFLLADMPFRSYDTHEQALANARLFVEQGADGVKLEGGQEQAATVRQLTQHGIAVCSHIGFTPQTLREVGKRARVQGRTSEQALRLVQDAEALEGAGTFLLVLELVPDQIARIITERLAIPTIGIGAGPSCDGQVLTIIDVLGMTDLNLRLARHYQHYHESTLQAIQDFKREVEQQAFPGPENSFEIDPEELAEVKRRLRPAASGAGGMLSGRGYL